MENEIVENTNGKDKGNKKQNKLLIYIVIAIIVGSFIGGVFPDLAVKLSVIGELFLNSLMMIVIPLVIFSIIAGVTGLGDIRNVGSIGWRTVLYYMSTTAIAVLIGLIMVNIINPGKGLTTGEQHPKVKYTVSGEDRRTVTLETGTWRKSGYDEKHVIVLLDQNVEGVIEKITKNSATVKLWHSIKSGDTFYVKAEDGSVLPFKRVKRQLVSEEPVVKSEGVGLEITLPVAKKVSSKKSNDVGSTFKHMLLGDKEKGKEGMIPRNIFNAMADSAVLPLIIFSLLFSMALSTLGKDGRPAIDFFVIMNDAIMKLVEWIMFFAPIGIFALIGSRIGIAGGFDSFLPELFALGKYSLAVLSGLFIHAFVILPLVLWYFSRVNPLKFARGVLAALLNAFSTASSSATLPITMECLVKQNKISKKTSSFVLPLGATINMDGTALYEAVAAMFIAQVYGVDLGVVEQSIIFFTATLAAIGAAGIPEAGLVTMVIVLKAVGLPIEGIGLLLSIDWLLDRFRTTVNVWGDSVGCGIIDAMEKRSHPE